MIVFIKDKLENQQCSSEQINGYSIKNNIPMVSHEKIYQYIYQDKENGGELFENLRTGKKKYKRGIEKTRTLKPLQKTRFPLSSDQKL